MLVFLSTQTKDFLLYLQFWQDGKFSLCLNVFVSYIIFVLMKKTGKETLQMSLFDANVLDLLWRWIYLFIRIHFDISDKVNSLREEYIVDSSIYRGITTGSLKRPDHRSPFEVLARQLYSVWHKQSLTIAKMRH